MGIGRPNKTPTHITADRKLVLALVFSLALSFNACGDAAPRVGAWQQADGYRWRELDVRGGTARAEGAHAGFTALSAARTGVTHGKSVV